MRGSQTELLLQRLSSTKNLEMLFTNKTIVGSSAGAYALSKYYFGNDSKKVGEGLGLLELKIFCHYKEDYREVLLQLQNYRESLPILVLPNYKWQVFFK